MTFKFYCTHCGQRIEADDAFQGTVVTCPACGGKFAAPDTVTTASQLESTALPSPSAADYGASLKRPSVLGLCLLFAALLVYGLSLYGSDLNGTQAEKVGAFIGRMLLAAGGFTFAITRFSYFRRLTFPIFAGLFFVGAVWFAYLWTPQKRAKQSTARLAASVNKFIGGVSKEESPTLKPVGDTKIDAVTKTIVDLSLDLQTVLNKMEAQVDSLDKQPVLSKSVLSDKTRIDAEIHKRSESIRILKRANDGFPAIVDLARSRFASIPAKQDIGSSALRGFDESIKTQLALYDEMFSIRIRRELIESGVLAHLRASFGDFEITGEEISFKTDANSRDFAALSKGLRGVEREQEAFRKKCLDQMEDAKAKILNLTR